MTRRNWKRVRPSSMVEALRLCKEFAQDKKNLSVERIADRMGVTHDSLYKWLAQGRLPAILIPSYQHVCCCAFVSEWLRGLSRAIRPWTQRWPSTDCRLRRAPSARF